MASKAGSSTRESSTAEASLRVNVFLQEADTYWERFDFRPVEEFCQYPPGWIKDLSPRHHCTMHRISILNNYGDGSGDSNADGGKLPL